MDTKLGVSWLVGERSIPYASKFMSDVASRLAHRVQLTTDGHKAYLRAVEKGYWVSFTFRHARARGIQSSIKING